jgi:hypothetical protein
LRIVGPIITTNVIPRNHVAFASDGKIVFFTKFRRDDEHDDGNGFEYDEHRNKFILSVDGDVIVADTMLVSIDQYPPTPPVRSLARVK